MTDNAERGFTLVELLVSLAILGMMSMLLLTGFTTGSRAWERVEDRTAGAEQVAAAQQRLRSLIERTYPRGETGGTGMVTAFSGDIRTLSFYSAAIDAAQPAPPWRYAISLSPGGALTLRIFDPLAPDQSRPQAVHQLIQGVRSLDIGYYGPTGWRTRWANAPAPPSRVRIRLTFAPGDRRFWPDLVIQPSATVQTLCVVDRNRGGCRGR